MEGYDRLEGGAGRRDTLRDADATAGWGDAVNDAMYRRVA
jgi:hypothetical protein